MYTPARDDGVRNCMADDGTIVRFQEVTEIVRQNRFLQGEDRFKGFRRAPDFRRVASIQAYAKEHGNHALDGDYSIIKAKDRSADITEPGDSIAEQGYRGLSMPGKITRDCCLLLRQEQALGL